MALRCTLAIAALWAATTLSAPPALAENGRLPSLDCSKAATPVETVICADPVLSELDSDMAKAYAKAIAVTPSAATVRAEQRDFLAARGLGPDGAPATAFDGDRLAEAYRERIRTLLAEIRHASRARSLTLEPGDLAKRCAVINLEDCKVEASGFVAGSNAYGGLFYQVQAAEADSEWPRGFVILSKSGGQLRPAVWHYGIDVPGEPAVAATPQGPLLVLPARHAGSGALNAETVFQPVAGGGWRNLYIDGWRFAFDKRIPKDVGVWKGVRYDWATLTAHTSLWTESDANCCPSGGLATAYLAIEGDQLVLKDVRIGPSPPPE